MPGFLEIVMFANFGELDSIMFDLTRGIYIHTCPHIHPQIAVR